LGSFVEYLGSLRDYGSSCAQRLMLIEQGVFGCAGRQVGDFGDAAAL
jgi:hypothetical protein